MNVRGILQCVLVATCILSVGGEAVAVELQPENRVTVIGIGEIVQKADMAIITFAIISEGLSAAETVRGNIFKVEELTKRLNHAKIADSDIQSTNFTISPLGTASASQSPLQQVAAYRVTELVRVDVRNLATFSELLDEVVRSGTTRVVEIQYVVSARAQLLGKSRQLAVENARLKATSLADAAGAGLGEVVNIVEITLPVPEGAAVENDVATVRQTISIAQSDRPLRSAVRMTFVLIPKSAAR